MVAQLIDMTGLPAVPPTGLQSHRPELLDGQWYEERNPVNLATNIDTPTWRPGARMDDRQHDRDVQQPAGT